MADNVTLNAMTGGEVVATDDIGGVHYQIMKLAYGPLNTATLIEATVGMPTVLLAGSAAIGKLAANSGVDIGDVDVTSSALPTGASTSAKQDTVIGHLDGVETLLGTIDADTSTIAGKDFATQTTLAAINTKLASGTVIGDVNLGATDNAVLDAIAASVAAMDTDLTTIIGHVDGIETLIGTTNTNTGAATTALQIMDDWDNGASDGASVSGDVAHDTADAGEPVKIGLKAVALKANPTEVAANDRTNWYADVSGIPFVLPGHMNTLSQGFQVTDADGAQTDAAIITAGANVAVVVTKVSVVADNANTGDVSVRIGFGTANTPAADAAQVLLFHPGIAPGSGVIEGSGSGILGIGASGEDVRVTCEDPVGGSVSIIVTYFTTDI